MELKIIIITLLAIMSIIINKKSLSKIELNKEGYNTIYQGSSIYSITNWLIITILVFDLNINPIGILFSIIIVTIIMWIATLNYNEIIIRFNDQIIELEYITGEKREYNYNNILTVIRRCPKYSYIPYIYVQLKHQDSEETTTIKIRYHNKKTKIFLNKLVENNIIESPKPSFFGYFEMKRK